MNVFSFQNYSWIPIFGTPRGNENWFAKSDISRNLEQLKLQGSTEERETTCVSSYRVVRKNEGLRDRDSNCSFSMTSIDSLVKSKTYKSNSKFLLVREVQENFKTALCGAISWKRLFFRATTEKSRGLSLFWFYHSFVHGSNIHLVDFYDTHVNDTWLFQNKLPRSLDHLTLTPSWQGKRRRK